MNISYGNTIIDSNDSMTRQVNIGLYCINA